MNGKPAGFDIDIANAVAKQLGSTAQIKTTGFSVIIGALKAKKCDAIISSMTITPQRSKQIFFIYTTFNTPAFNFGKLWAIPSEATTGIIALSISTRSGVPRKTQT